MTVSTKVPLRTAARSSAESLIVTARVGGGQSAACQGRLSLRANPHALYIGKAPFVTSSPPTFLTPQRYASSPPESASPRPESASSRRSSGIVGTGSRLAGGFWGEKSTVPGPGDLSRLRRKSHEDASRRFWMDARCRDPVG